MKTNLPILQAENLQKSFNGQNVLNGVNLTVNKGEKIVVIGESGCGKSTLLRCLNQLVKPDAGRVIFDGQDLWTLTGKKLLQARQKIGMVFQNFNLFPHFSVLKNLTFAPLTLKLMDKQQAEENALALLKKMGLFDKAHAYPASLSGGQKQRVAILRALCLQPHVMLFDEPTSALDPKMSQEVLEMMKTLAYDGMTMVVVTHEMNFAKSIASRVIFLDNGTILEQGDPNIVLEKPRSKQLMEFLMLNN